MTKSEPDRVASTSPAISRGHAGEVIETRMWVASGFRPTETYMWRSPHFLAVVLKPARPFPPIFSNGKKMAQAARKLPRDKISDLISRVQEVMARRGTSLSAPPAAHSRVTPVKAKLRQCPEVQHGNRVCVAGKVS